MNWIDGKTPRRRKKSSIWVSAVVRSIEAFFLFRLELLDPRSFVRSSSLLGDSDHWTDNPDRHPVLSLLVSTDHSLLSLFFTFRLFSFTLPAIASCHSTLFHRMDRRGAGRVHSVRTRLSSSSTPPTVLAQSQRFVGVHRHLAE